MASEVPFGQLNQLNPADKRHLDSVLQWCGDALAEGENFLRSQVGYKFIPTMIDYVMGDYARTTSPGSLSQLVDNRFGKAATDFAAGMTDIKPFWEYHTANNKYEMQATLGNKIAKHWWTSRLIDVKFADVIKYSEVGATGYAHLTYDQAIADMDCIPEDPRDVLPIRPNSNYSLQEAFGVIVRRERTVNYLRAKYPNMAKYIRPDRDMSAISIDKATRANSMLSRVGLTSGFMQNFWASIGGRPVAHMAVPSADVFTMYVKDDRRNESSGKVWVGEGVPEPGKHPNWSYWVEPGDLLYPRGRQITFCRSAVLRDGPSIFWHGLFPLVKITLDPWPWTWLGKPPLLDIIGLQEELNRLVRGVSDHNQKVFRPDLIADKNALSRSAMNAIDTRRAGLKLRTNPVAGKTAELAIVAPLDPSIALTINDLREEIDKLSGVRDLTQLMQLGQIPSTETIEKILESMSPAIRMRSRMLEASLREFAMITLSNIFQFYSVEQRVAILGMQGITFEDFDMDPGNVIPAFMRMEDESSKEPRPAIIRAREFLHQFTYDVAPGSLLSASEVTKKLLYIQLFRAGVIDIWTLAEILGIPNYGNPPEDATTITKRLIAMQNMGLQPNISPTGRKASGETMPKMQPGGNITESK
jgi:hypothetical protein